MGLLGLALCLPAASPERPDCRSDAPLPGKTLPAGAVAIDAGYRLHPILFLGAGYSFTVLDPRYDALSPDVYGVALTHAALVGPRLIAPIRRVDLGAGLALGWARQAFFGASAATFHHQVVSGFALRPSLSVDTWVHPRVFVGARADLLMTHAREHCTDSGTVTVCERRTASQIAGVHTLVVGLSVGGTFR